MISLSLLGYGAFRTQWPHLIQKIPIQSVATLILIPILMMDLHLLAAPQAHPKDAPVPSGLSKAPASKLQRQLL